MQSKYKHHRNRHFCHHQHQQHHRCCLPHSFESTRMMMMMMMKDLYHMELFSYYEKKLGWVGCWMSSILFLSKVLIRFLTLFPHITTNFTNQSTLQTNHSSKKKYDNCRLFPKTHTHTKQTSFCIDGEAPLIIISFLCVGFLLFVHPYHRQKTQKLAGVCRDAVIPYSQPSVRDPGGVKDPGGVQDPV